MTPTLFHDPYGLLPRGEQSPEPSGDIAAKIRSIRSDPKHAYNVPHSAGHDAAVREVAALYARLPLPQTGLSDEVDVAL